MVPIFEYDIEEWQPNRGELSIISYEDNRSIIQYFGKWENIKVKLPAIAEVIGAMAGKDHIMVAKMDSYVKDLIDKGIYRFTIDKQGEILPTIRDADGFVKQVRLEDMALTPNLTQRSGWTRTAFLIHSGTSKWKILLMRNCLRGIGAAGCRSRNSSTPAVSSISPWR